MQVHKIVSSTSPASLSSSSSSHRIDIIVSKLIIITQNFIRHLIVLVTHPDLYPDSSISAVLHALHPDLHHHQEHQDPEEDVEGRDNQEIYDDAGGLNWHFDRHHEKQENNSWKNV